MTDSAGLEKSEKTALQSHEHDMRLAISCVADVMLLTKWSKNLKRWLLVVSPRRLKDLSARGTMEEETDLIMLRCGDGSKLYLELDQHIEVLKVSTEKGNRFRVVTLRYIYAIWETPDKCLIGWHYHPDLEVSFPHVHVYDQKSEEEKQVGQKPILLHKMHIPSGRVSVEDVVRFAINELGVLPDRKRRQDWEKVLLQTEKRIAVNESWSKRPSERK